MKDDIAARRTPFSTHWGTYYAETRNGKLHDVHDWTGDPDPAVIGPGLIDMIDHPTRIRAPMVRESFLRDGPSGDRTRRGKERFVEVTWDEALDLAAGELGRVRDTFGNAAIYGGSYGWASAGRFHHAQSHVHRFLNMLGGYTASISNYSYAAANAIAPHIVGSMRTLICDGATSWPVIAEHSELIVAFGGLARKNAQITSGGVGRHVLRESLVQARANGASFINVSPLRTDIIPEVEAEWLAPRPNTDTALMLGLAYTLLEDGLHDQAFLDRCTVGWDVFHAYLIGQSDGVPKDADWAAAITEIDADTIRALARRMAGARTMITVAWSLQRADHGEQPIWMAVVLAAMLGQIGLPGGGFGIGYASENGIGNSVLPFQFPSVPQGQNAVRTAIPVARVADMLLNPGAAYDFNGEARTYPDIRAVYWTGGNPFHHHQDLGRLVRALHRPECVIVNEIWWTPLARHADIVFPVTTMLEREDLAMTHWEPLIVAMRKAIEPFEGARTDYDIFSGLAERLGLHETYTEGRSAEEWVEHLWNQTRQRAAESGFTLPTLAELREAEMIELPPNPEEPILLADFVCDPAAHPLGTPSGKIEIHSSKIAGFGYDDCPGHPVWLEPVEWLGAEVGERLHLISNQPRTRLHSQFDPGRVSAASKINGREPAMMHPDDAARRGISDGDTIRLESARGACFAGVILSEDVRPGVLQLSTGAWFDPVDEDGATGPTCAHGNVNVLTRDSGTSRLGQGCAAQSTLVSVSPAVAPPPVRAFVPPEIVARQTSDD